MTPKPKTENDFMNTPNINPVQLITIKDAAKRLAISTRTIHREISAGRFPRPVKMGRSSRVSVATLEAYVLGLAGISAHT